MLTRTAALGLNHLLHQHAWARERLAAHAGRTVEFRSPPLPSVRLRIDESGEVSSAGAGDCDLVVDIRPAALPFFVRRAAGMDATAAFEQAFALSGHEGLARAMRELLLELEWDAEEDLSRLIGDVAAHRLVSTGRDFLAWQREAAERLAHNFSEYFGEERRMLLRRPLFEAFTHDNMALFDALERLEQRVAKLSGRPPSS